MNNTDVFSSLTPPQQEAVRHINGPLLILAGPGSGKTRVVTHRIAHMLQKGVPAWRVLALTFTNKAADEMRSRVERLVAGRGVWMGTFHSFCARLLRSHASLVGLNANYSIYDTDDSKKALKLAIEESDVDLVRTRPEAIANAISWAKNNLVTPEAYIPQEGEPLDAIVQKVYPAYRKRLLESNAVDFDDLLLHVAMLLKGSPELRATLDERYRYILVDEYQDTNLAQYAIVRALSINHSNLAVTGDPDQSIYGWRGANLNNILDFEKDFNSVKVVRLEQNFRSTPNILRAADQLIAYNVKRKPKRLYTEKPDGAPVKLVVYESARDEADDIAQNIAEAVNGDKRCPKDFAVFYRINALSRQLEHALRRARVPYQVVSGLEFYQRREIKDVLAYLHLLNNPQNDVAFLRIVNTPSRGIGKKTLERLTAHARRHGRSLLEAARESRQVSSIAKGISAKISRFVAMY
ncbi:MAG: UvrD-helicase domain-containing protein, partial [Pirellulaceae bacterium]|nr:UvrD-helicase domain-containing protein [Pirellulaceae bacterium]